MCGTKSNRTWLALLLLSLPLSATYSERVYEITETELTQLETELTQQSEIIDRQHETLQQLSMTMSGQQTTLTTLSQTIEKQRNTIDELRTSYETYVSETRWREIKIGGISLGIGVSVGALTALLLTR